MATITSAPFAGHTAWIRWEGDRAESRLTDIQVVLDLPRGLTLRRGYSLPPRERGPNARSIDGPKTGIQMTIEEAYAQKQKFDEHGRIVELKGRLDWIRTEWIRARDRGEKPIAKVEAQIQRWCEEDAHRVQAGTLAQGPVVLNGRPHRTPNPGERVPEAQLAVLRREAERSPTRHATALLHQFERLEATVDRLAGAVPVAAGGTSEKPKP